MEYAFKYDDVIKNTKRAIAKERKAKREAKAQGKQNQAQVPQTDAEYDEYEEQNVNIVEHYEVYLPMLKYLYDDSRKEKIYTYTGDYHKLKQEIGFRPAYLQLVEILTSQ